jgi:hypothetical protein
MRPKMPLQGILMNTGSVNPPILPLNCFTTRTFHLPVIIKGANKKSYQVTRKLFEKLNKWCEQ